MSSASPTHEHSGTLPLSSQRSRSRSRAQRVLACVLCQQRKVKCDRKFPCGNCIKFKAQCVPSTRAQRRRRRRFPEQDLLDRIGRYEELLRSNSIKFEPLQGDSRHAVKASPNTDADGDSGDEQSDLARKPGEHHGQPKYIGSSLKQDVSGTNRPRNFWHAMVHHGCHSSDGESDSSHEGVTEAGVRRAWDNLFEGTDVFLWGSRGTAVDVSTLHPEPVQIFKLWQIYLENVDPLLKVTHTPSVQGRLIEAAGNTAEIDPTLEALMFSIYSVSLMSLTEDECHTAFNMARDDLLTRYQFGCQQALLNCGYMRTEDRECLTAFHLFLVSLVHSTDPRSLSSMLGIAIRIARRLGIHSEFAEIRCNAFEIEMRRRLWWSLRLFDSRIGEMADYKNIALTPTWTCKVPLNVNDSELSPEMKELPPPKDTPSEALFLAVRSELGEFVRHTKFHLDFTSPTLKPVASNVQPDPVPEGGSELDTLEKKIEGKYLKFCNPGNPLQYMTLWMARTYLAKMRLVEHLSRYSDGPSSSTTAHTEAARDAGIGHALSMLECDTKLMGSPLTKGYRWLLRFHFPLPAYIYILQHLRRRPLWREADHAWEVMSDNFEVRMAKVFTSGSDSPLCDVFIKIVLPAWDAREAISAQSGEPLKPPRMISHVRESLARRACNNAQSASAMEHSRKVGGTNMGVGMGSVDELPISMSTPTGYDSYRFFYDTAGQDSGYDHAAADFNMPGQSWLDAGINQLDLESMDWDFGGRFAQ